ncbi:MAG: T9SS type A sorting domain-containing protein [Saprospiraceae bacterium]|nr:T9SS type A sorting domain-containing protein [Saprospiraceae bacterium]HMW40024.1 T9SS type A sorting domain-containing protein [Saprospiraceae bacterium]HMX89026.1 T9SS type A sorting domain-containing protein [Saprospiraceae bacterium]HMZ40078.1 T9SS type A sorting domain-containing protein [Saprospiraceae bacterium]HNA64800.1 T9SS type A sorting domain-containing protein [Saprospiraceae bacterium]
MKKTIILLFLMAFSGLKAPAQLSNTTWHVYNPSQVLAYYIKFGTDTVFYSDDFMMYSPLSIYKVNGNTITFIDIPVLPVACPDVDTGHYKFDVRNDTLLFKYVFDLCAGRAEKLTSWHWIRAETKLHNTYWNLVNPWGDLVYKFHFGTVVGSISADKKTYEKLYAFYEQGNSLSFIDIPGVFMECPGLNPAAFYTFDIRNDTLFFTKLSDECPVRVELTSEFYWVRTQSGVSIQDNKEDVRLFPNPSSDGLFYLNVNEPGFDRLTVLTLEGKIISEMHFVHDEDNELQVNLADIPPGVYALLLHGNRGIKSFRLIKQQ